jgi:hypothetical protein
MKTHLKMKQSPSHLLPLAAADLWVSYARREKLQKANKGGRDKKNLTKLVYLPSAGSSAYQLTETSSTLPSKSTNSAEIVVRDRSSRTLKSLMGAWGDALPSGCISLSPDCFSEYFQCCQRVC